VKFVDNIPTVKHIGRAIDGFKVPERDELDDANESKWEKGPDGKPRDPWTRQSYLPLEDLESGDIAVFVSGSSGGRSAIGTLCGLAAKNHCRGHPHIKLGVRSYKHKLYGRIETPDFPVVGWAGDGEPVKSTEEVFNDTVPF
jgi:hypothetical protein